MCSIWHHGVGAALGMAPSLCPLVNPVRVSLMVHYATGFEVRVLLLNLDTSCRMERFSFDRFSFLQPAPSVLVRANALAFTGSSLNKGAFSSRFHKRAVLAT